MVCFCKCKVFLGEREDLVPFLNNFKGLFRFYLLLAAASVGRRLFLALFRRQEKWNFLFCVLTKNASFPCMQNPQLTLNTSSEDYSRALYRLRDALKAWGRIYLSPVTVPPNATPAQQARATEDINQWCTVMEGFVREGGKPARTRDLFRYYLSLLGLNIDQSFLDAIKDGDVVEIFRDDATRLFFNPELFDYSSYTPEEMFTIPCPELYRRDEAISEKIYMQGYALFKGAAHGPIDPQVPAHIVSETLSERRYSCEINLKLLAPVRLGYGVVAVAALERFKLLLT